MQKTKNFQLNQWEKTDRIQMEDFNGDNERLDAALAAEQAARESAVSALNQAVAGLGNCQIATGTYTGTGTRGASGPNRLTFPFEPKLVIVQNAAGGLLHPTSSNDFSYVTQVMLRPLAKSYLYGSTYTNYLTWSGNSLSWYCDSSAEMQMNTSGTKYLYLAIG